MGQKTALVVTAGLTLFVLMTGGLLALTLYFSPPVPPVVEAAATSSTDSELVHELLARDALFQARLAEANRTIQQANAMLQQQATTPAISVTPTPVPELASESAFASALAPAQADEDEGHYETHEHEYEHEEEDDD